MTADLVSCIVPVFNGERYLKEALDSILQQTHRPLQIIVADDGSTDGTSAVAAAYGEQIVYLQQPNRGPGAARNLGIAAATGEFVAFLDADDLWHPEKVARQLDRFRAHPALGGCVTRVQNVWIPELRDEAESFRDHRLAQPVAGYCMSTPLVRRTLFETVGLFDAALQHAHATDWFLRAEEQRVAIEMLPETLAYRRLHHSNRSRLLAAACREEYLRIVKAHLDRRRAAPSTAGGAR